MLLILQQQHTNAQFLQADNDILGDTIKNFFNLNPLDGIFKSSCWDSILTGGTSGIKKTGQLIVGTDCDDKIRGDSTDEVIYTLKGNDQVWAGSGNDIIYGGMGSNRLYGERSNDIIIPGDGSNLVDGGPGNDVLYGGVGNNLLVGGRDNDQLIAGTGTTIMDGGIGSNEFDCSGNSIVINYNPDYGDTIAGNCKIVNNMGTNITRGIDIS